MGVSAPLSLETMMAFLGYILVGKQRIDCIVPVTEHDMSAATQLQGHLPFYDSQVVDPSKIRGRTVEPKEGQPCIVLVLKPEYVGQYVLIDAIFNRINARSCQLTTFQSRGQTDVPRKLWMEIIPWEVKTNAELEAEVAVSPTQLPISNPR